MASRLVQYFAGLTNKTIAHTHTYTQTDHATPSVAIAGVLYNACDAA